MSETGLIIVAVVGIISFFGTSFGCLLHEFDYEFNWFHNSNIGFLDYFLIVFEVTILSLFFTLIILRLLGF